MANDGSRWVTTDDIEPRDANALKKLWDAREEILKDDRHNGVDRFGTYDGWHWYNVCSCAECVFICERLEIAQAELEVCFKSVAITSEIADSNNSQGFMRVAAWFEAGQRKAAKQAGAVQ